MSETKPVIFLGSSLEVLRALPVDTRREAGYQIDKIQRGVSPDSWKPAPTIGAGVQEIRISDISGQFRVFYVAKFTEAVYILHCFHKETQKIPKKHLELAAARYRELLNERKA